MKLVLFCPYVGQLITLNHLKVGGDPKNMRGWMEATITLANLTVVTGPVCGATDYAAYYMTCFETGWLAVIGRGTAGSLS